MSKLRKNYGPVSNTSDWIIMAGTDDGSPTGDNNANVDGSVTPVEFFIAPEANATLEIFAVSIEISDAGSPSLGDYGNVQGPLANGVVVFQTKDGVEIPLSSKLMENRDLVILGPESFRIEYSGNILVTTYEFNLRETADNGITIRGKNGDRIGFRISDDLSALINHSITFKGLMYVQS